MTHCQLCFERIHDKSLRKRPPAADTSNTTVIADLCHFCVTRLPWIDHACQRCGAQLTQALAPCDVCPESSLFRDQTVSAFSYRFPIDNLIQRFKYQEQFPLLNLLAQAVLQKVQQRGSQINAPINGIVPVPMHPAKLRARGFNQCFWLARRVSLALDVPLLAHLCIRTQLGTAQSLSSGHQRRTNLDQTFSMNKSAPKNAKHLVILDDVITTGSTVENIAALLKSAGIQKVSVWTIASAFG